MSKGASANADRAGGPDGPEPLRVSAEGAHPLRDDDIYIEVCTNCGGYFTPRKDQDYYDTRCGRCG